MDTLALDTPQHILDRATADIEAMYALHGIDHDLLLCFRVWDDMYQHAIARTACLR